MISTGRGSQLVLGAVVVLVVGYVAVQMYFSTTPPRHADHDHAMASIDAGGFLRIEDRSGERRNLVGRPGRVLVLHFFDPRSPRTTELAQAARFARSLAGDEGVEVLFVARGESWDGLEERAKVVGIPLEQLYLDKDGYTGDMLGVQRWPETLIYDPRGLLAYQAKGSVNWASPDLRATIDHARSGVTEIE